MIKMNPKSQKSIKTTKWRQTTLMTLNVLGTKSAAEAGGGFSNNELFSIRLPTQKTNINSQRDSLR
jgi:hypothetical protein